MWEKFAIPTTPFKIPTTSTKIPTKQSRSLLTLINSLYKKYMSLKKREYQQVDEMVKIV